MRRSRARVTWVTAVMLVALAACGGGGENDTTTPEGDEPPAATEVTLTAQEFAFDPAEIQVDPGAEVTLTFENQDDVPHTFTSDDLGVDERADAGGSVEASFTAPESGSVEFHCEIHTEMTGTIIAGDAQADTGGGSGDKGGVDY